MRSTRFLLAALLCVVFTTVVHAQLPNAWQINDNSTAAGSTLAYYTTLTTAEFDAATNNGWSFTFTARMVTNYLSANPAMFAIFGNGVTRYGIGLNLDSSGRLVVIPLGGSAITLTSDATSATNYHTHELEFDPATQQVTYRFDGTNEVTWPGETSTGQSHELAWGSDSSADRGDMNFHQVRFEILGQGVNADYNAGFAGNPATAPSPATQGWNRASGGVAIPEGPISPDVLPLPPLVNTLAATAVQPDSATLNAQLHPDGLATGCYFEYGATTNYGNFTPTNTVSGDNFSTNVSIGISGLSGGTIYHFRAVITNSYGAVTGADLSFTTPVYITTQSATALTANSATLNASVVPYGLDTGYYWEYGTTTNYGSFTPTNTVPGSLATTNVSTDLSGLSPATTYHFRAVATNGSGLAAGTDLSFTTPADVTTLPASAVTLTTATLNASLHPYGLDLAYHWEYGTTTNYGKVTATNLVLGSVTATNVSARIGGLSADTTYHFRCAAANTVGVAYGQDLVFSTPATLMVTNLADSGPGTLRSAVAFANSYAGGADITFAPSLTGQTIDLTSGGLMLSNSASLDASSLTGGITIAGNRTFRLLEVGPVAQVVLDGLTLRDGNAPFAGYPTNCGGGILNFGRLALSACTLLNNQATNFSSIRNLPPGGGGIENYAATLMVNDCLFTNDFAGDSNESDILLPRYGGYGGGVDNESGGTLAVSNSTFADNLSYTSGGGICSAGGLTLNQCTVAANSTQGADGGGGICVLSGNALFSNCAFTSNSATLGSSGGGIAGVGTITLNDCTLTGNHSTAEGGAVEFGGTGTLTLNRCTLTGNFIAGFPISSSGGGGIANNYGATNILNNCTLADNSDSNFEGGAIYNLGPLTLNNCTLTGNSATYGGAIYNDTSFTTFPVALTNCTLSGNSAALDGGGIDNDAVVTLRNTIVAGNISTNGPNFYNNLGFFSGGNNLLTGNPLLAPLGNYGGPTPTMPPLTGSPAIDAGNDSVTNFLATDQRGDPRRSGAHVDIGAVEVQFVAAPTNPPPRLKNVLWSSEGGTNTLQFTFTNIPDADFTALASTNVALPLADWTVLGNIPEISSGQYQFTGLAPTNDPQRFFRVVSP